MATEPTATLELLFTTAARILDRTERTVAQLDRLLHEIEPATDDPTRGERACADRFET